MKPGTRAAIFMLNDKLSFVQGFTDDNALLAAAINDKRNRVAPTKSGQFYSRTDAADDAESLSILTAMMGSFATGASSSGVAEMGAAQSKSASFQYARRVAMTLEALSYLARYLGNVPGRKNLLWFAGNFPVNIFPSAQQSESLNDARVYASQIQQDGRSTHHRQSCRRLPHQHSGNVMNDHMLEANSAGPGGMADMQAYSTDNNERANAIFTMNQLASDTGGHAFYNTNDLATAANRAISEGSHYYTLVYSPTNKKMDGKFRQITVKLTGGHSQLSYRRGYNADDPATLASTGSTSFLSLGSTGEKPAAPAISDDPLRPLLMRGLPSASQLLYAVRVVPADPQPAPDAKIAGKESRPHRRSHSLQHRLLHPLDRRRLHPRRPHQTTRRASRKDSARPHGLRPLRQSPELARRNAADAARSQNLRRRSKIRHPRPHGDRPAQQHGCLP